MEFEFDPNKSQANQHKHGIDFDQAQDLWRDPGRVEIPARIVDEPRWLIIGRIDGEHWSAVVTLHARTTFGSSPCAALVLRR